MRHRSDEIHSYGYEYTCKHDVMRRLTYREAVCGPVIHTIFNAWHYERSMDLHVDDIRMRFGALDTIHHTAYNKLESKLPDALHYTLPSTLLIALNGTLPACLTYALKKALKTLPSTLPGILSRTLPIVLDGTLLDCTIRIALDSTLPACLTVRSQLHLMKHSQPAWLYTPQYDLTTLPSTPPGLSQVCSQLHSMVHSQPTWLYAPKYTLKREDTPNLTGLYAPMYAPASWIQRLAELQTPGTGSGEAGILLQAVFGGQRVGCGRWQVAYVGRNHDVGWYHSLNVIFSQATAVRSQDASDSWCRHL